VCVCVCVCVCTYIIILQLHIKLQFSCNILFFHTKLFNYIFHIVFNQLLFLIYLLLFDIIIIIINVNIIFTYDNNEFVNIILL